MRGLLFVIGPAKKRGFVISMLCFDIPGRTRLAVEHLVLDYNGTLALDGSLLPEVKPILADLCMQLSVHVLTADTFGRSACELQGLTVTHSIVPAGRQDMHKKNYVEVLGSKSCVCIGNGCNDFLMLQIAAVGIAVPVTSKCLTKMMG